MGSACNNAHITDQDDRSGCDIERAWRQLKPATIDRDRAAQKTPTTASIVTGAFMAYPDRKAGIAGGSKT